MISAAVKRRLKAIIGTGMFGVSTTKGDQISRSSFIASLAGDAKVIQGLESLTEKLEGTCSDKKNIYISSDPLLGDIWHAVRKFKKMSPEKQGAITNFLEIVFASRSWKLLQASGRKNEGTLRIRYNMPKKVAFSERKPTQGGQSYTDQPTPSNTGTRHEYQKAGSAMVPSNLNREMGKGELAGTVNPDALMENKALPAVISIQESMGDQSTFTAPSNLFNSTTSNVPTDRQGTIFMKFRQTKGTTDYKAPHDNETGVVYSKGQEAPMSTEKLRSREESMIDAADSITEILTGESTRAGQMQLNTTSYSAGGMGTGGRTTMGGPPGTDVVQTRNAARQTKISQGMEYEQNRYEENRRNMNKDYNKEIKAEAPPVGDTVFRPPVPVLRRASIVHPIEEEEEEDEKMHDENAYEVKGITGREEKKEEIAPFTITHDRPGSAAGSDRDKGVSRFRAMAKNKSQQWRKIAEVVGPIIAYEHPDLFNKIVDRLEEAVSQVADALPSPIGGVLKSVVRFPVETVRDIYNVLSPSEKKVIESASGINNHEAFAKAIENGISNKQETPKPTEAVKSPETAKPNSLLEANSNTRGKKFNLQGNWADDALKVLSGNTYSNEKGPTRIPGYKERVNKEKLNNLEVVKRNENNLEVVKRNTPISLIDIGTSTQVPYKYSKKDDLYHEIDKKGLPTGKSVKYFPKTGATLASGSDIEAPGRRKLVDPDINIPGGRSVTRSQTAAARDATQPGTGSIKKKPLQPGVGPLQPIPEYKDQKEAKSTDSAFDNDKASIRNWANTLFYKYVDVFDNFATKHPKEDSKTSRRIDSVNEQFSRLNSISLGAKSLSKSDISTAFASIALASKAIIDQVEWLKSRYGTEDLPNMGEIPLAEGLSKSSLDGGHKILNELVRLESLPAWNEDDPNSDITYARPLIISSIDSEVPASRRRESYITGFKTYDIRKEEAEREKSIDDFEREHQELETPFKQQIREHEERRKKIDADYLAAKDELGVPSILPTRDDTPYPTKEFPSGRRSAPVRPAIMGPVGREERPLSEGAHRGRYTPIDDEEDERKGDFIRREPLSIPVPHPVIPGRGGPSIPRDNAERPNIDPNAGPPSVYTPTLRLSFVEGNANEVLRVNEDPAAQEINRLGWQMFNNYAWDSNEENDNQLHLCTILDEVRRFQDPLDKDELMEAMGEAAIQYNYDKTMQVFDVPEQAILDGTSLVLDTRGDGDLEPKTADEMEMNFHEVYMEPWINIPEDSPWKEFTAVNGTQLPDSMRENPNRMASNDAPMLNMENQFIYSTSS